MDNKNCCSISGFVVNHTWVISPLAEILVNSCGTWQRVV